MDSPFRNKLAKERAAVCLEVAKGLFLSTFTALK